MDFSKRAAQSCSSSGIGAGATGISSPIRTEEAMNAPPERNCEPVKRRRPVWRTANAMQLPVPRHFAEFGAILLGFE
jgi:hypothetical protein